MMQKTNDYVRNFVTIFFIRKTVITFVAAVIIFGAVLYAFLYPPVYGAACSVILKGGVSLKNPQSIEDAPVDINTMGEDDMFSEIEIIKTNVVAKKAAENLVQKGVSFGINGPEKTRVKKLESKIRGSVAAGINPRSNTINVKTRWNNPGEAEAVLEAVMDSYFNYRSEIFQPREAEKFFADQLERFKNELEEKEQQLQKLTLKADTPAADSEIQQNLLNMKNLERQLFDLRQQYFDQKYKIDLMEKDLQSGDTSFFSYLDDPQLTDMSDMVMQIIRQRNQEAKIFHPKSEKIQNYNDRIQKAMGRFKEEVEKYISAEKTLLDNIENKIGYVKDQIQKIRKENMGLYKSSTRSKMLERQIAILEDSYTTFTKRLEEAKIGSNYNTNKLFTVSLLTEPEAGNSPVFPNKNKVILMGILGGLILGLGAGFMVEFFDHTFKTPEDVENNTDMVYIFSIS